MKLFLVILCALGTACSARKSETSLAPPTTNAESLRPSVSPSPVRPQQSSRCSLTKAQAPVVIGLKLGMTSEEVLAIFPGSKNDPEIQSQLSQPARQFGVSSFVVHPEQLESKNRFAEFTQFTFTLLDGRVSSLNIGYKGPTYSQVDQFVKRFVERTKLPSADQWQPYPGLDNQLKILTCKDFEVRVFANPSNENLNYVSLTDLEADKALKDRRAKARAQTNTTSAAKPEPSR